MYKLLNFSFVFPLRGWGVGEKRIDLIMISPSYKYSSQVSPELACKTVELG